MMNPLSGIRPPVPIEIPQPAAPRGAGGDFGQAIRGAVESVDNLQKQSQNSVTRMLAGEVEDLHKVAIEHQQAALAFDLLLQVRNKAVQAYQEVMRMQV
jgi:flagellar hook-basal body complex protein FliE